VLPATDTPPTGPSAPRDESLPLVLFVMAGLIAAALLVTSPRSAVKARNR
jgi:hypothetical protein